jgi:hypothetical protein
MAIQTPLRPPGSAPPPPPPPPPPSGGLPPAQASPPIGGSPKPPWWKPRRSVKWWSIATGIVVALVVIAALAGNKNPAPIAATTPSTAAPSAAAPTASAATAAPTAAPTAAIPAAPASFTKSGAGDSVITVPAPFNNEPTLVTAKYSGSSNFAVETLGTGNSMEELLVNAIGNYSGVEAMDFDGSNPAVHLQITGSGGRWSITFSDPSTASAFGTSRSGRGDAVVAYTGGSGIAAFTSNGQGNFAVMQFDALGSSENLLVNEIGNYTGSVPIDPSGYLVITSDGRWTVTVSSG